MKAAYSLILGILAGPERFELSTPSFAGWCPDPEAKDVHTITFDKKGMVYFTFQWANMIGRLNPESGDIKLVKVAAERSQPYDIKSLYEMTHNLFVTAGDKPSRTRARNINTIAKLAEWATQS